MSTINLGNVTGIIRGVTPPSKTYVMWGKIIDPTEPDIVQLRLYDGVNNPALMSSWYPINNNTIVTWSSIVDKPVIADGMKAEGGKLHVVDENNLSIFSIPVEDIVNELDIDPLSIYNSILGQ